MKNFDENMVFLSATHMDANLKSSETYALTAAQNDPGLDRHCVELCCRCIFAITMVLRIRKMRWCITDTKLLCALATSSTSMTIVLRRDWRYEKNYAKEGEWRWLFNNALVSDKVGLTPTIWGRGRKLWAQTHAIFLQGPTHSKRSFKRTNLFEMG